MKTILQLLGGIQSNDWGDISPHPPRVSAPLFATNIRILYNRAANFLVACFFVFVLVFHNTLRKAKV